MRRQVPGFADSCVSLTFPAHCASGTRGTLSAYSCGGSHGLGPLWVRLTVFPFHLLYLLVRQNHLNIIVDYYVFVTSALSSDTQVMVTSSRALAKNSL